MSFTWLKQYMPRSLYGRAALILILPVLVLQIIVSVAFIQSHFEGVTEQMTRNIRFELDYLRGEVQTAPDRASAEAVVSRLAPPLALNVRFDAPPVQPDRLWYDFSGLVVISTLQQGRDYVGAIDLGQERLVVTEIETRHGVMRVSFDRRRVSASNPHQLLVWIVLTGVLMTVIAFIFLRNQLRPIKRLAAAASAFGKGEVIPYKASGASEVREAGHAFLSMRARIERQIEQRTMILSGVSHDLRTPLTRMRLGLSMSDDPDVRDLDRDAQEMEQMLEAFLSFARDDAAEEREPLDVPTLLQDIVNDAQRAKRPVILGEVEETGPVALRKIGVRRAIENLIGNAVRYGKQAQVSLMAQERTIKIVVEDDGPGIPAEVREEAVKPFARLEPGRNQNRGSGVGLGLSIASDIARAHGGTLQLGESPMLGGLKAELVLAR